MERLEIVEAVQRMQDFIEKNIHVPISLYDLAKCAQYSPFYCAMLFKELIGKSPFEYIRMLSRFEHLIFNHKSAAHDHHMII